MCGQENFEKRDFFVSKQERISVDRAWGDQPCTRAFPSLIPQIFAKISRLRRMTLRSPPCSCMSIEFWEREDLGTNVRINFSSDAVVGLYLWLDRCTSFILNETFLSSTLSLVCLLDLVVKAANNRKHKAVTSTKFKPYICIKGGLSVPYNWCASQGSIIFFPGPILPFSVSWTVYCSHISNILFSLRKKQAAGSVCSRKRLADFSETEPAHWLPSH